MVESRSLRDQLVQREAAKTAVALFGGLLSGSLALLFFMIAPLVGVPFLPTAAFPYGTVLNLLHMVIWVLCPLVVMFMSNSLLTFTFLVHVVAALLDAVVLLALAVPASASFISASLNGLQYGFVLVPLIVLFVVGVFVSTNLWRLGAGKSRSGLF